MHPRERTTVYLVNTPVSQHYNTHGTGQFVKLISYTEPIFCIFKMYTVHRQIHDKTRAKWEERRFDQTALDFEKKRSD